MNKIQASDLISRMQGIASQIKTNQTQTLTKEIEKNSFGDLFTKAVHSVNEQQLQSTQLRDAFERNEGVELPEVMLSMQKARISLEAAVQVRNQFVKAYQEIMNMQF